ncbi:MAG: hypothetical protein Q8O78_09510 [Candidatus Deferrimicrobium sp.]|nr:hypothetical protein [Candidatus Deferrimicrobium sp.]
MGRITDDMTRLVGEIKAGHRDRQQMMQNLRRNVSGLLKGFAGDLAGARRAWGGTSPGRAIFKRAAKHGAAE